VSIKEIVVIYHAGCLDGVAAAAAFEEFREKYPDIKIDYRPEHYGRTSALKDLDGKDVYIVDFSYPPEVLEWVYDRVGSITMLDHHQSAIEKWDGIPRQPHIKTLFDTTQSGASMAWAFVRAELRPAKEGWSTPICFVPTLVQHVSDRDLWQFKMNDTKELCAYLMGTAEFNDRDMAGFAKILKQLDALVIDPAMSQEEFVRNCARQYLETCSQRNALVLMGRALTENTTRLIKRILNRQMQARRVFGYENIPVVNLNYEMVSEAGDILCQEHGYQFAVFYEDTPALGIRKFSLRSRKGMNVRVLAERMGGGGHDSAAGFTLALKDCEVDSVFQFFL